MTEEEQFKVNTYDELLASHAEGLRAITEFGILIQGTDVIVGGSAELLEAAKTMLALHLRINLRNRKIG